MTVNFEQKQIIRDEIARDHAADQMINTSIIQESDPYDYE